MRAWKGVIRSCLILFSISLAARPTTAAAGSAGAWPVLQAMKDELARSMPTFQGLATPPYFISYEITEDKTVSVTGSFGKITHSSEFTQRQLDIDLRVGSQSLDNTHAIRSNYGAGERSGGYSFILIPLEDDAAAIRSVIWYYTDLKYKQAVEQLGKIKGNVQVKVEQEDKSADFSGEPAARYSESVAEMRVNRTAWEEKIRKYTAPFAGHGNIYGATASFLADRETRWYVNSDGSEIQVSQPLYHLSISAHTKADDGMELPRYESFVALSERNLPGDREVLRAVDRMIADLEALRKAPIVEPYTGPAILSGRASGVFFHEVFGHRIEGHRQKAEEEGQTFKKKVNEQVLPTNFSVYSDPTLSKLGNTDLAGTYRFDNEGVKAQRVAVVDHGIFRNFLMSRSPIEGFPHSNGHGRRQQGYAPVARQSNLMVEVSQPVSRAELKKKLIEMIKEQGKPFGLYFEDIQGGFTLTGRSLPNAFNVLPIMVYRVYADGREELVRGVDLIGTPLTTFSRIVAADDEVAVFNGVCGAESGSVPVSASSPGILISQVEVQKKSKSQERLPILPPPFEVTH